MPPFPVIKGSVDHASEDTIRRPIDMSELLTRAEPDNTPFLLLSQALDFAGCTEEKTQWQERGDEKLFVACTGGVDTTTTTINVHTDEGDRVVANDVLYNPLTGEQILVTAVTADALTVKRAIDGDGTTGSAIADDQVLYVLASAMEEGSSRRDTTSVQPAGLYNYVQTTREGWKVAGRIQAVKHYGQDPLTFVREDKMRTFLRKLERKYLIGVRNKLTVSGMGAVTFSGGLKYFMDAESGCNQEDQSAVSTWTRGDFESMMKSAFAVGSSHKIGICGWDVTAILGSFAWDKLQIVDAYKKELGITIRRYISDYGILDIMPHKLFTATDEYGGMGLDGELWVFDPLNIKRSGLAGRSNLTLFTGPSGDQIQDQDEDAVHQELWVEDTLQVRHAETMYRAYGIASGVGS